MMSEPKVGRFLDSEEEDFIQTFEGDPAPLVSDLTPERRGEIEAMARASMSDERAKISLRVSKRDLVQLKSRALQVGIPYQTLINALIHRYVSG
jgi:predicted DNA binding CopG/RHH family protein